MALTLPSIASAQAGFVPQPTPTADQLAITMKALGTNPRDLAALIRAGELSAQLDDGPAAMQFFARAEKIAPSDPRIAAGRARALVRMGRPGEALRGFARAEAAGLAPAGYAGDRGLAYDLTGQTRHAQMEYARALAAGEDDEVRRRYAISLAISGDAEGAAAMLDPQLRQRDRAGWRARALTLAIGGELAAAEKVAVDMMPGFGTAYIPLFRRLSEIRDPADRAFAAHLGEFTRSPARMADATMAPPPPPIATPVAPVRLAQAAPAAQPQPSQRGEPSRRSGRERPVRAAAAPASERFDPLARSRRTETARSAAPAARPAAVVPASARTSIARVEPSTPAMATPSSPTPAPAEPLVVATTAPVLPSGGVVPGQSPVTVAQVAPPLPARVEAVTPAPMTPPPAPAPAATVAAPTASLQSPPVAARPAFSAPVTGKGVAAASSTSPAEPTREPSGSEILAAIVSRIAVPASELDVAPIAPSVLSAPRAAAPEPVAASSVGRESAKPVAARREEAPKAAVKPAPKPKAVPKPPAEPARHWVQVAGGARVADLPKAWSTVVAKAPALLKSRGAWTTPLRATNRLLTGPFDSASEAQQFVNKLAGQGVSAFPFTSEAGQKVEKLPVR
ncbi:SPOR domain-containing protein [Sphingomonas sp.]